MNKSAHSVDLGYTNMSTLVDKEQIKGAHRKIYEKATTL